MQDQEQWQRQIVVATTSEALLPNADNLAQSLGLQVVHTNIKQLSEHQYLCDATLVLLLTTDGLKLKSLEAQQEAPIWVDFTSPKLLRRAQQAGAAKQTLAKAIGIKPGVRPNVIDATAGLGRDGFVLAALGCHVTLIERHPIVAALLNDGLQRGLAIPETANIIKTKIKFIQGQAVNLINQLSQDEKPEVIYLDPMFPHRDKSALVKKEMRLFQSFIGADEDIELLFDVALKTAKKRVVVKRPSKGPGILGKEPQLVLTGKSTRYDIYFTHK